MLKLLTLAGVTLCTVTLTAAADPAKVAEVNSGKRTEAMASWWGFDPVNASDCLQQAINSPAEKLIIDNTGKDWLIERIELRSDQEIVVAAGVTVRALPGAFKEPRMGRSVLFSLLNVKNVILRGEPGAVIKMNKEDYQDKSKYQPSEFRHLINILGGKNIVLKDLKLESSGGDGIYLGTFYDKKSAPVFCRDITIENVHCHDHHRQGLSVICAENLLVRNSVFSGTKGTPPQAGIDFEPNTDSEMLVNCRIENCRFEDNQGHGVDNYLLNLSARSKPVSITYRNCQFINNRLGIKISIAKRNSPGREPVKGKIEFVDCEFSGPSRLATIIDTWDGFPVTMRNCRFDNRKSGSAALTVRSVYSPHPVGNVTFDGIGISDRPGRFPLALESIGLQLLTNTVTGEISVNGEPVDIREYVSRAAAATAIFAGMKPAADIKNLRAPAITAGEPAASTKLFLLRPRMLLDCKAGQKVTITLTPHKKVAAGEQITVALLGPDGTEIRRDKLKVAREVFTYDVTAEKDGLYTAALIRGANGVLAMTSDHPGQGLLMGDRFTCYKPDGDIYFRAPVGIGEFKIAVGANPGKTFDVKLIAPDGKTIQSVDNAGKTILLSGNSAAANEIWRLNFSNAVEYVYITLTEPLPPLLSPTPGSLLVRTP